GSAMKAAIVSGPSRSITASSSSAQATPQSGYVFPSGQWKQNGAGASGVSASSGWYGARRVGRPDSESAVSGFPWYEVERRITLWRGGWPFARWYARAIFTAVSVASEPPETR